jgi:hypothetical protein
MGSGVDPISSMIEAHSQTHLGHFEAIERTHSAGSRRTPGLRLALRSQRAPSAIEQRRCLLCDPCTVIHFRGIQMNYLRSIVFLLFATAWALGQPAHQTQASPPPDQPELLVRNLYHEVVVRHPSGLLYGADMKIFAPYLSKTLLHRIELTRACGDDWARQNQGRILKAPFSWPESGLFSGGDEKTSPGDFQIEKTQAEKDRTFRVDVRLTYRPTDGPGAWRVTAIVREDGHFAVDDVIYLTDRPRDVEGRLSEVLSQGCDGPRWVGLGGRSR